MTYYSVLSSRSSFRYGYQKYWIEQLDSITNYGVTSFEEKGNGLIDRPHINIILWPRLFFAIVNRALVGLVYTHHTLPKI
jgi:hypothetical protein